MTAASPSSSTFPSHREKKTLISILRQVEKCPFLGWLRSLGWCVSAIVYGPTRMSGSALSSGQTQAKISQAHPPLHALSEPPRTPLSIL